MTSFGSAAPAMVESSFTNVRRDGGKRRSDTGDGACATAGCDGMAVNGGPVCAAVAAIMKSMKPKRSTSSYVIAARHVRPVRRNATS
jgi:hypothetical protein